MPPAFVLSQDQTLQTKLFKTGCPVLFRSSRFNLVANLVDSLFIYYDFAVLFRTSKSFSRVHRTIQFSKSFADVFSTSASLFSKLRFAYQAQRGFNLAPFFDLSNQFLIFFKSFFSTASFKLSSF